MRSWLLALAALACCAPQLRAQDSLAPLSFVGIDAGVRLDTLSRTVTALGGPTLRCQRSRDAREVQECRGTLFEPVSGKPMSLWLSAMDSLAGILSLSGPVSGVDLDSLRAGVQRRYGVVDARVQGAQWMMQWVRQGRMLRFTWRIEKGQKILSISLVDGRVLDAWGKKQELRPRPKRPSKAKPAAPADSTMPLEPPQPPAPAASPS